MMQADCDFGAKKVPDWPVDPSGNPVHGDKTVPVKEQALRYNQGKLKWSLVHYQSLEPMVRTLMFGAEKYSPGNWAKGLPKKDLLESIQRHLAALMDGETNDSESSIGHMGHILCNGLFYNYMITHNPLNETI